jgi:hypothetical protein
VAKQNWGVLLYLVAALASLSVLLAVAALPRTALHFFQQPTHEDLVGAIQSMYGWPLIQAEAPARSAGNRARGAGNTAANQSLKR